MSSEPLRIAAVVTTWFPTSHAGVLVDKFIRGFPTDDGLVAPRSQVVSLYIDQVHEHDVGRQVAYQEGIPLHGSIRSALTLGGDALAVDAVLLVAEHGDYPTTALGQEMLPRRWFFEQIVAVMTGSGRRVPVFNDKHLAYRWDDARWMVDTAREAGVPLWAASALPVAWRRPDWQHPDGASIDEALVVGFHMIERYGFHGLESLQCQVERRDAGEQGVRAVQCLSGREVWEAGRAGRWSWRLAEEALACIEGGPDRLDPGRVHDPHVFLVDYVDGLRAAVLMLGDGYVKKFAYAQRCGDRCKALEYHLDTGPTHAVFGYLALNVEDFFLSRRSPTPLERTLLTTGILEAAMISRARGGRRVETPHLSEIRYRSAASAASARRPRAPRPRGASVAAWPVLEPAATPAAAAIPVQRDGTVRGASGSKG